MTCPRQVTQALVIYRPGSGGPTHGALQAVPTIKGALFVGDSRGDFAPAWFLCPTDLLTAAAARLLSLAAVSPRSPLRSLGPAPPFPPAARAWLPPLIPGGARKDTVPCRPVAGTGRCPPRRWPLPGPELEFGKSGHCARLPRAGQSSTPSSWAALFGDGGSWEAPSAPQASQPLQELSPLGNPSKAPKMVGAGSSLCPWNRRRHSRVWFCFRSGKKPWDSGAGVQRGCRCTADLPRGELASPGLLPEAPRL